MIPMISGRTASQITTRDQIVAHETLAIANGEYVIFGAKHGWSPADMAICARLAFHHANVYNQLREWANTSKFARVDSPITE